MKCTFIVGSGSTQTCPKERLIGIGSDREDFAAGLDALDLTRGVEIPTAHGHLVGRSDDRNLEVVAALAEPELIVRNAGTELDEAAKCALISMDSTIKSNLSVGLPLDLMCYERDSLKVTKHKLIDSRDEYFSSIRGRWADQLKKVFNELPEPGYWNA